MSDATDPLAAVLDALIPPSPDGRLPGAGALGLAPALRECTAAVSALVDQGLAAADAAAAERGAARFADLGDEARVEALRAVESSEPGFLPGLLFHLYALYYRHPRVLTGLGVEPRPPHPQGYALEPGDLGPLERVRARGRLYREV